MKLDRLRPMRALRDDRRMGNRQAERVTEQGGDGEPVGDGADHGGFGEGGT